VDDKKIQPKTAIHLFSGAIYGAKSQYDEAIIEFTKANKRQLSLYNRVLMNKQF